MNKPEYDDKSVDQRAARHIADMGSDTAHLRERALEQLTEIGPDPVLEQLLTAYRHAQEQYSGTITGRRLLLSLASGVAGFAIYKSLATCNVDPETGAPAFVFGVLCSLFAGFVFNVAKPKQAAEFRRQSLLRLLCISQSTRVVSALCDCLRINRHRDLYTSITSALVRLLPEVKGILDDELSPRNLAVLRSELHYPTVDPSGHPTHTEYQLAILQCIQNLGDVRSIPAVERLPVYTYSPLRNAIRDRKNECLEVLYRIRSDARPGENLLRSSQSPTAATELLREAESPEADPDELLRPGEEPGNGS